jgi:hypothetical protein
MSTAAMKKDFTPKAYNFSPTILREYDIRGQIGKNLSENDAFAVGCAFGTYVRRKGGTRVCVGYDGRASSPIFADAHIKNKFSNIRHIEIVSDSKYVILGVTEWIGNWMQNNWRNANRKSVLNRELWEELYKLNEELKPKWTYVKGHNEDKYNDRADLIATSFAEGEPVKLKK